MLGNPFAFPERRVLHELHRRLDPIFRLQDDGLLQRPEPMKPAVYQVPDNRYSHVSLLVDDEPAIRPVRIKKESSLDFLYDMAKKSERDRDDFLTRSFIEEQMQKVHKR